AGHHRLEIGERLRAEHVLERAHQLPRRVEAAFALLFEAALHDALELGRDLAVFLREGLRRVAPDGASGRTVASALKWAVAREQLVQDDAQRKQIAALVEGLFAHLLG